MQRISTRLFNCISTTSMKLEAIRISNFQCFGPTMTEITFEDSTTMVLGPNGSGKTAIPQWAISGQFSHPVPRYAQR
ncbi:AAA family ATPase [Roseibacillus persicicus]|uniref:AAA family ATPase n=1 Tax=Roseibacillus persicicus TaxID=454148 RepID=UPI00281189E2|nr:AAA family ATPase [Roseibacillus persicicus]